MKQKRNEQTPISEHGVRILIMMILVGFGILIGRADANKAHREDAEQVAEPQVVQHELVLRVEVEQTATDVDFCATIGECLWQVPTVLILGILSLAVAFWIISVVGDTIERHIENGHYNRTHHKERVKE